MTRRSMRAVTYIAFVTFMLIFPTVPSVTAQNPEITIDGLSLDGQGVVAVRGNTTYIWQEKPYTLTIDVGANGYRSGYELCISTRSNPNKSAHRLTCKPPELDGTTSITFEDWPSKFSGEQTLLVTYTSAIDDSKPGDRASIHVIFITREGDLDTDGLSNEREFEERTGFLSADTDRDGIEDGGEVHTYGTDPTDPDTDDDGLRDRIEISGRTNATVADTDGDRLIDGKEVNEYETNPLAKDTDDDGLNDYLEVTAYRTDPAVADTDDDGLNDFVEVTEYGTNATVADTDGDGLLDGREVLEYGTNATVPDTDGDGLEDGTERQYGTFPTSPFDVIALVLLVIAIPGIVLVRANRRAVLDQLSARFKSPNTGSDEVRTGDMHDGRLPEPQSDGSIPGSKPNESATAHIVTDEDRVLQFLREHDGPVPQKELVEETGWSASKVSRLLSSMEEDGEITKITLGRENVIRLGSDERQDPFGRNE